ncbi:NAD(P)/FAD-dependent oxidoreductase [Ensifer sp. ENS06]|uniref:flavin-containing monooxygenase n=1 Tax=Ensifer sp. ENS06 TaxID=2769276 RepID=UPI000DDFAD97|nr:NAD(P)/FAD-dependent oxidoreductase [Ensifer sp. ENS06]MBD9624709.1 NAD(P)/FAD-dependent oxidoreductase [Ensifer sp. ENS06]
MSEQFLPIVIIGAGFSGVLMAVELRKRNIPFVVIEKSEGIGGTWFENTYPGAGCDVLSTLYSYSFAQKPDWSRRFAPHSEIRAYLEECAERYDIRRHIRLGTEVVGARYVAEARRWDVALSNETEIKARAVVFAVGQLNRPSIPSFRGRERFSGVEFHSARWRHDHDLTGKRVAVVGSGASAIQFLPHVAREAKQVILFQRSPNWIIPKNDRLYHEREKRLRKHVPLLMRLQRAWEYLQLELSFPAFLKDSKKGRKWEEACKAAIASAIKDPVLQDAVTPDYPAGCKRVLLSDDWFPTLARDNVQVVTSSIAEFGPSGLLTDDGVSHPVDVVIYATGFETRQVLAPIPIEGARSLSLQDAWQPHPHAYLGVTVPDFPNAFIMYGPNTNLGHGSIVFMLECQARYIGQAIAKVQDAASRAVAPKRHVTQRFNADTQARLSRTVWGANCSSWYKGADGVIVNNWSSTMLRYWWKLRRFKARDYDQW